MFTDDGGLMIKKQKFECIQLPEIDKVFYSLPVYAYSYILVIHSLNKNEKNDLLTFAKKHSDNIRIIIDQHVHINALFLGYFETDDDSLSFYMQFKCHKDWFDETSKVLNNIKMINYIKQNEDIISLNIY